MENDWFWLRCHYPTTDSSFGYSCLTAAPFLNFFIDSPLTFCQHRAKMSRRDTIRCHLFSRKLAVYLILFSEKTMRVKCERARENICDKAVLL